MTLEELDNYYKKNVASHLNDEMKQVLTEYTGFGHADINLCLTGREPYFLNEMEVYKRIDLLRNSIAISKLPNPLVVYHGTGLKMFNDLFIENYYPNQKDVLAKTFLSTSLDKQCALSFRRSIHHENRSTLLKIYLPQNFPALWMKPLSVNPKENELLLENNINFNILGYDFEKDSDNQLYQLVEVSPILEKKKII